MDPGPHRNWPHPPGGSSHGGNNEQQSQSQPPRPGGSYGLGTSQHHQSPPSGPGSSLPPPGAPFPSFHQPAHNLASLAGISQSSPRQPVPQSQAPPPNDNFSLPGINQATGQSDRERERAREAEQYTHIKEEEGRRNRERMEQAPQHQSQPGPPPHLHQPVALGPRTVHGPNGLLSNPGLGGQPQHPHLPLGAPSGPANIFAGGPVQPNQGQQMPGLLGPYGAPAQGTPQHPQQQQIPQQQTPQGGPQAQGQGPGQQPILNDALSYLDQVKVQFADHPDVYNRFLDIMKDFKSGAIDTPGVIGRVSTLFAGNPQLIQGFNTFLPPGYRIECGADDDPNAIRVTTPMGTTVSSIPQPRPLSQQGLPESSRPANGTFTPQPGGQGAQMMFSPSGRPLGPVAPNQPQHLSPLEAARQQQEQQAMHQQEQRGVNSLQSAVSAAAGGAGLRAGVSPMPGQDASAMIDASQAGIEKRGPVEFNHAISYVNKIKNRFSAHPDIYKQFLEILQTYQRESKPIQDVYGQVTHLFKTAPDLLEDFKQFLPESAAQAKAAERARQEAENNVLISNVRGEGGGGGIYGSPVMSREAHMGTPGGTGRGLPPVGNFAPTPASKDNKRKRDQRQGTAGSIPDGVAGPAANKAQFPGQPGKRAKPNHTVAKGPIEPPPSSPTLIPALPAPIEPTTTSAATSEELSFFDKAKKAIGNKNTMNEFLKLCNLFSQDLIDRTVLVHRARFFIGANADLMKWFQEWVGYDERDIVVENKPRVPSGRVMLSNCRGLGPSYRLLPKRERQKPCSGRDELCNSVLNDEWASHPTWASEDSGFIAHRKNLHEEGLHRIEEERHDYDFNIETCSRTIQLMEPIATQLRRMDDHSQRTYTLPPGLGGQSETIYKRVIMKLYARERGAEVIQSLHERPYQVIPVLLNRLKERLESWKMAQREWEKVWREQTQKMFWKSLDHQAASAKQNDRRQFQLKTLQGEIQVRYEEMKRAGNANPALLRQPQMEFTVDDIDVLYDTTYLVLSHVEATLATDQPKLFNFIRDFVPLFFGLDAENFRDKMHGRFDRSPNSEMVDDDASGAEDSASMKSRKTGPKNSMLRAALTGRKMQRKDREDSNASGSRASTPDVGSNADEEPSVDATMDDAEERGELATGRWMDHPTTNNDDKKTRPNVNPHEPQVRTLYRCWANTPIYCFVRLFVMLYERLYKLKISEAGVREAVKNANRVKPAVELGIIDKLPGDFFPDVSEGANYYTQMLQKFDEVVKGELEFVEVEEALRRFYLQSGYPLYPFEKIVNTLARDAIMVMNSDSKDKSAEVYALFRKDRQKETSTAQQQTDYRKSVEKMVKDAELYRIDFDGLANKVLISLHKKDDPIADDGLSVLDRENKWRYYVASYTSVDNTDGINFNHVHYPFRMSNIRSFGLDPRSETFPPQVADESARSSVEAKARFLEVKNEERLQLRIAVGNYKAFFQKDTFESWFVPGMEGREGGEKGVESAELAAGERDEVVKDRFVNYNSAMEGVAREGVDAANESWRGLVEKGVDGVVADGEKMNVD